MATKKFYTNKTANESLSKYKLLSAYGGPGSIMHTQYGSIIVSCIDEWGFIKKVNDLNNEADSLKAEGQRIEDYVKKQALNGKNGSIEISNDFRLLNELKERKKLTGLKYLANVPSLSVNSQSNKIEANSNLAIPSSYMPKVFRDNKKQYKQYNEWYELWKKNRNGEDNYCNEFHPPKYIENKSTGNENKKFNNELTQDNIVLICEHGHISDFPWSKFLRWRIDKPSELIQNKIIELFEEYDDCCKKPNISINENSSNSSGFDGKWLKCTNCNKGTSLKGLMGVKIKCPGHKPWEAKTGNEEFYSGDKNSRISTPPIENCFAQNPMKVALTTGNNIYYANTFNSIYLKNDLFKDEKTLRINELNKLLELEFDKGRLRNKILIDSYESELDKLEELNENKDEDKDMPLSEKDIRYRFDEYNAFHKEIELINSNPKDLKVTEATQNLNEDLSKYFKKILRIDQMKITTAQLDFSRVVPIDADADNSKPKNIYREDYPNSKDRVVTYPVVESYGEGIFFSFDENEIDTFFDKNPERKDFIMNKLIRLDETKNQFSSNAITKGNTMNWPLYLVHTFSHLIMRELEFRAGYPTASLSERLYVSNDEDHKMYGCLIYTAEGSEGSMGGLIAQTRKTNLNQLLKNAINRATICNSDPLCWSSDGQGLFDLNLASCFSCSLVSETSCEHSNLYLDRQILVDREYGFFKDILSQ